MEQGSPPGYVAILAGAAWEEPRDRVRVQRLPPELREELLAYMYRVQFGPPIKGEQPCIWLDRRTRRCRHYDWRPEICRMFEVGSPACVNWRRKYPPIKE
jgi:Fe-S-cluster containining protein